MNRPSLRTTKWSLALCLCWLGSMALTASAFAQLGNCPSSATETCIPVFPKYMVLGVVYAPPGSSSSVTYGNSNLVGSSDSVFSSTQNQDITTHSVTVGGGFLGFGATKTTTTTNGWTSSFSDTNTASIQTMTGNSVSTAGPISSSLGVNHDNDVIYILLNPVMVFEASYSAGVFSTASWSGLLANGCDINSGNAQGSFVQQLYGCDPNQYPYPDIVGIPVWCLKNPYYPGQGCLQWQQYLSRSWDNSYRGPAAPGQTNAYPADPTNPAGLTLQDYADILQV